MEEAGWLNLMALFLNIWEIRIAVLSSFAAHLVLVLLAGIRRRKASGVRMLILWLAYQLSNWVAPYALSNLSLGNTSRRQQLVAFWATFLMHHLAGPDNISAFSLEDNELSGREALNVFSRIGGAIYVLYKHVYLSGGGGVLIQASIIIFSVGAAKYLERALALWRGDLGNIRSSTKKKKKQALSPDGCACTRHAGSLITTGRDHGLRDEQALMVAHDMLPFCKRAMADSSVSIGSSDDHDLDTSRKIFTLKWENMGKVLEMEISLMYDILYTKASVSHTLLGYALRVASPLAITIATVLFGFYYSKEGQTIADVLITYVLLAATFLLDMIWLLRALGSTWTHAFLQASRAWRLRKTLLCSRRWHRLRSVVVSLDLDRLRLTAPPRSPSSYRRWLGTVGQYSLLHECTRNRKISTCARAAKAIGLEDVWNEYQHSKRNKVLDDDVKRVVFTRVRKVLMSTYEEDKDGCYSMKDITTSWGQETAKRRHEKLLNFHLAFGHEFQEDILVWHIATQAFLITGGSAQSVIGSDKDAATHAAAIKVLSEHLMFLVAMRGHMLPGLALHSLYEVTLEYLQKIWGKSGDTAGSSSTFTSREENLAKILVDRRKTDMNWGFGHDKTSTVRDGANLAVEFLGADESEMPQLLKLVFDVWIDKLLYAATRCSPESHAKQLSRGGDLTTIVWIMAQHAGPFQIGKRGIDDKISDSDDEMQPDEKKRPEKKKAGDKKTKEAEEKKKECFELDYPPHMYPPEPLEYPPWPEFWVGPPGFGGHGSWMDPPVLDGPPVDQPVPSVLDERQEIKPRKRRRERHRRYATLYPVD